MSFAAMMLVALVLDALIGWPDWLFRRIGHPVTWIGALIGALDGALNRPRWSTRARVRLGALTTLVCVSAALLPMLALHWLLPDGWIGVLLGGLAAWPLVAARGLYDHVAAVARPLAAGAIQEARAAVALIVGRDPQRLDRAGIARAALESLAENASDGVVAPIFWGVLLGLPGIAAYKAINTLDSMIGHRTPRHAAFGYVAARLDDAANLIPARLTGPLLGLASGRIRRAIGVMRRDARQHRSPNAGWPEAAMAGALGVRLSGPRVYADSIADEPWLNAGAADPQPQDLSWGLRIYIRAMTLLAAALAGLAWALA
ncbi:MAG: adenosylcobinamide-phosphate synthase CbiB [Pseudomonadota bacterium]